MYKQKIRILHIGLSSHLGGIETYLLKIASYADKELFQYDFLSYCGDNPCYQKELERIGCNFFYIPSRKKNYVRFLYALKELYLKERFDIVHAHLNSLSSIEPCLMALKCGCKVIVHSRNAGNMVSLRSKFLHHINYHLLPKEKICCVAVSDLAGEWMFGENTKFIVLNNGIDTEKYKFKASSRKLLRRKLNIDDNNEVIIHVGAFRAQKNHTLIIDVFREYLKKHPYALLLLIGDGDLKYEITKTTKQFGIFDSVVFLGERGDIPALLSAADKFLFPSFYEGFPNALLEAETSGLQCVVSDSITKQAILSELCSSVSLDAPVHEWVSALEKPNNLTNREAGAELILKAGLDISSEIKKLSDLYFCLVNNNININN